jgi:hypothetical protein
LLLMLVEIEPNLRHAFARQRSPSLKPAMNSQQLAIFDLQTTLTRSYEVSLLEVTRRITAQLLNQQPIHPYPLRTWMNQEFSGTDAEGKWNWKDAYEAQEIALISLLDLIGKRWNAQDPLDVLARLVHLEQLTISHTRRSEESVELQQFSTPLPLAYLAAHCAQITPQDIVLEPSAGTGMLAKFAQLQGAQLLLNEWSDRRQTILRKLFPGIPVFSFNAEQIHDYLPLDIIPTVVLMNPPFSASPHIQKRYPLATVKHIRSAFLRLAPGGRLVVITAQWFAPSSSGWNALFQGLDADVRLTVKLAGKLYAKHGTQIDTRLTIVDKPISATPHPQPESGFPTLEIQTLDAVQVQPLLEIIPPRSEFSLPLDRISPVARSEQQKPIAPPQEHSSSLSLESVIEIPYDILDTLPDAQQPTDLLYEVYQPRRIYIPNSRPHPTTLCESITLASVLPPIPQYHPHLPQRILAQGILSEAQLESLIYAGEAHTQYLRGRYHIGEHFDSLTIAPAEDNQAVAFRRGWFLGDGTGAGKGRQIAGIILDNFLQGRNRAIWISKSDKLIEDARRDWVAIGGAATDVVPLSKYKQGQSITLTQGILFTTYATLRTGEKPDKPSRLQQILNWVGADFDGVIAFDEAHAMGNAIAEKGSRGIKRASQQGIAGLRLQNALPNARVLYVSATGATQVSHLAYASRLGLWQTGDFPFADRLEFIQAIESGGVAAMEVVCRDLKVLGLYFARNLSFDGVEYEALEVQLTPEQIQIYDRYAGAFQIIHNHLEAALTACNITQHNGKALNGQAKAAAKSLFESQKQRFFNHLITSMKCPTLLQAIAHDLATGKAVVIQIVSTNEEMLKRRLAETPVEEWSDLNIDITPRFYILHNVNPLFSWG